MTSTLDTFASQSALDPSGTGAQVTYKLTWIMSLGAVVIFAIVIGALWLAWRKQSKGQTWWIVAGGVVFPLVVLSVLLVGSVLVLRAAAGVTAGAPAISIKVTGYQYWWDVVYDPRGRALRGANEVWVPVGQPVEFILESADVIHSFWVPRVAGKMDMVPGHTNRLIMTATEAGRFRGQCAEFCGLSHPLMAFEMVAVPQEEFAAFLDELSEPVGPPEGPLERRGQEVFLAEGCAACHEVRGLTEGTAAAPDLTRVGARASLGAGMWRMNVGNLAGWIADVQDMKPGANMPSYNLLDGPDLRSLAHWLGSLE